MALRIVLLAALAMASVSRAETPRFDSTRLTEIDARMNEFVRAGKIAGAVTLVATPEQIVHLSAVGQADIAAGRTMKTDAIFRVASMTKPVTATALAMLVEQGKLSYDDPVAKYIPAFAGQKLKNGQSATAVTIRDVLTHTAGIAQPSREDSEGRTLAETVDRIGGKPLDFAPGSKWQYSSGLTVAGRLIEIASGESYADYLQKHIFGPLGMQDTAFQLTAEQAKRLATMYKPGTSPGAIEAVQSADPTVARTPNPSGGLYSTAADMARFYQAVLRCQTQSSGALLPAARAKEMLGNHTPGIVTGFTPGNCWGLGWCVVERPQGVSRLHSPGTFGHGGAFGTQGWVDPARGLIFVLMIQRSGFGNSDGSDVRDAFTEAAIAAHRGVETSHARFKAFHNYTQAVELQRGPARAVIGPQAGGRVLEFSLDGRQALYLDEQEQRWQPGSSGPISAGRFDFGPELTVSPHAKLWSGDWTAEIVGEATVRLASPRDEASGMQLLREFTLAGEASSPHLACTQTLVNLSSETREVCHWGRSFSPGGGICLVPLAGTSRFPSKYAMYEDGAVINVRATDERIRQRDGFLEILGPPRKPKLGFDSYAGWLGYLMPSDLLLVKRFATYPDRVYNEAAGLTLSVWYPEGPRIELEPIGPRERLQPGEAASFTEHWWLLRHPFPKAGATIDLKRLNDQVAQQTGAAPRSQP